MLRWHASLARNRLRVVCVYLSGVRSRQRQWRGEEGGIEDGGIGENWTVVMDAMQRSGTLGLSVIKGPLFFQHKHTHTHSLTHLSSLT